MYVTTDSRIGDFQSPFGSFISIPPGMVVEVTAEQGYWLVNHPDVRVEFKDANEEAYTHTLIAKTDKNPLRGLSLPQNTEPNATLQFNGRATRIPVLVANPAGLLAEQQSLYQFETPKVTLEADRDMVRGLVAEILAAAGHDVPTPANSAPEPQPVDEDGKLIPTPDSKPVDPTNPDGSPYITGPNEPPVMPPNKVPKKGEPGNPDELGDVATKPAPSESPSSVLPADQLNPAQGDVPNPTVTNPPEIGTTPVEEVEDEPKPTGKKAGKRAVISDSEI